MKKERPKTKAEFAAMLMRDYGYSERLSNECAAIVAGHGGFPKVKQRCIQKIHRYNYHKEANPTCSKYALPGRNFCHIHNKD